MRAADLQQSLPMVERDRSIAAASKVITEQGRIGVVVCDSSGAPIGMITALDVFRLALPDYLVDDPSLAATLDEASIDDLIERLRAKTVAEAVSDESVRLRPVPVVDADATVLEIAAVLVSAGSAIAVVGGTSGSNARFVTLPEVLRTIVRYADGASGDDRQGEPA
jgi:CBS domain-containing protein